MKKMYSMFGTTALTRAAKGQLHRDAAPSNRATSVYGFSNYALKKTEKELKAAWISAASSLKETKGNASIEEGV